MYPLPISRFLPGSGSGAFERVQAYAAIFAPQTNSMAHLDCANCDVALSYRPGAVNDAHAPAQRGVLVLTLVEPSLLYMGRVLRVVSLNAIVYSLMQRAFAQNGQTQQPQKKNTFSELFAQKIKSYAIRIIRTTKANQLTEMQMSDAIRIDVVIVFFVCNRLSISKIRFNISSHSRAVHLILYDLGRHRLFPFGIIAHWMLNLHTDRDRDIVMLAHVDVLISHVPEIAVKLPD